jgi:hypothetical protein
METFLYKLLIYALSIPKQICNVILKVYDLNNTTGNGIKILFFNSYTRNKHMF